MVWRVFLGIIALAIVIKVLASLAPTDQMRPLLPPFPHWADQACIADHGAGAVYFQNSTGGYPQYHILCTDGATFTWDH